MPKWMNGVLLLALVTAACGRPLEPAQDSSSLHPLLPRYPDEIEVTALYGPLRVREGRFDYVPAAESAPWSAWYYPLNDGYFFATIGTGPDRFVSPFEKYDYYARHLASPGLRDPGSDARRFERERYRREGHEAAADWMGYCHATAAAAILAPMPRHSLDLGEIRFTIGDLKALLVRTYENVEGSRNFGSNFGSDRRYRNYIAQADLYPDQLHRLIEVELGEKRRSFYVDVDLTPQIWNEPVLWAHIQLTRDAGNPRLMHARLSLATAKSVRAPARTQGSDNPRIYDFLDSTRSNPSVQTYTYDLHGEPQGDGSFRVEFGEWTEDSMTFHPDFATVLPDAAGRHFSSNPHLRTEIVEEILSRARPQ